MKLRPESKKIIINITGVMAFWLIFLGLFIGLASPLARLTHPAETGFERRITYAYRGEPKNTIDVAVIGNSDAYRGFSPLDFYQTTGVTSVVSGLPKQSLKGTYGIVKDLFKYQKPKLVVIETDCAFDGVNDRKVHRERRIHVKGHVKNKRDWKSWESALITGLNYEVPFMRHHGNWKKLKPFDTGKGKRSYYKYSNKGMAYSSKVKKFDTSFDYMSFDPGKKGQLKAVDMMYLEDIVKLCHKNGATPVFLTVPSANTWNYTKSIAIQIEADRYGVKYYDYNRKLPNGFDWSKHTKDGGNHLNYQGARILSNDFARALMKDFRLRPTGLTAQQRRQWKNDYKYFHRKIAKDREGRR